MPTYEPVYSVPVLGIEDGYIVLAATVLGRWHDGAATIHVRTWEAGIGQRDLNLSPAEFAEWRRSFVKPEVES